VDESDDKPWRGPSSIFLISRSSCAFINLSSQEDLERAVAFFNGRPLRPWDARCPRMVCRVRRKDDDLHAGVGAQRGTGMHRDWITAQVKEKSSTAHQRSSPEVEISRSSPPTPRESESSVPPSPAKAEHPPEDDDRREESASDAETRRRSTASYASTNSSFLARHFPKRIFILKSATTAELEDSVETGLWKTQQHNVPILGTLS
jgi:hypothetical protein